MRVQSEFNWQKKYIFVVNNEIKLVALTILSVLEKIAYYRNRSDEVPNQELARELAETNNRDGIREIAQNLWHKNKSVQSDCLKVLYEIG